MQNTRVVVSNLTGSIQSPDGVSILVPESPTFIDRFMRATRVTRTPGVRSCHETAVRLKALRQPAGFWIEGAPQAVVCITNEADHSDVLGSAMLATWEGRVGLPKTSFSLVAPGLPRLCGESDPRLEQIVHVTNGVREELCSSNWSSTFDAYSRASFGFMLVFQLPSNQAMRSQTLEVSLDGIALPATGDRGGRIWAFDGALGAIRFEPLYAPAPAQRLRATWASCDAP